MKRLSEKLSLQNLKEFLDEKTELYNRKEFIETDPVLIPHRFTRKEDIEIAGFFAATFAWGKRSAIISKATLLLGLMDNSPYDFIMNSNKKELSQLDNFVHRTFNSTDAKEFCRVLKKIYNKGGLKKIFSDSSDAFERISQLHAVFSVELNQERTLKHISSPGKGSAAKRINMYLRWMVRKDKRGVDLGIWNDLDPATLICPLDVHSGNVARKLGLLDRKQNDWQAAQELTKQLRIFDKKDPVKYDFALFGLGVFEGF